MSLYNSSRSACKDIFKAFLVSQASYEGDLEIPIIAPLNAKPTRLTVFSKAANQNQYDSWIHFYEDDASIERIWNRPRKYLSTLSKFQGVIAPDFSLYRDMPLVMQYWNIYRSHAIAAWLQENGVKVIPNVRWGDERTYEACCTGVAKNATIAIGSHGCIKCLQDRSFFVSGLAYVVRTLRPKRIIVYGTAPTSIFEPYKKDGIEILQFESDCMRAHRKAVS